MVFRRLVRKAKTACVAAIAALSLVVVAAPAATAAATRIKVGVLTCASGPNIGLLIASSQRINCSFVPDEREVEHYTGHIRKLGLEVGVTAATVIVWAVFAAQSGYVPGSLAGDYVGVSASESVVIGLGANILVGGSHQSIVLQPLSVQAQAGLNLAIGVAEMNLQAR